jgi:hypothetical protein
MGTRFGLLLLALGALAASILVAAPAAADNIRLTGSFSFTDPTVCVDPVNLAESYDEQMHVFYDKAGNAIRLAFTGKVRITYTDVTTGASYSPNSSGPGTIDLQTGQTVIRGGNGAFFDSSGLLVATDGRTVIDSGGNVVSIVGNQDGICAKLGTAPA